MAGKNLDRHSEDLAALPIPALAHGLATVSVLLVIHATNRLPCAYYLLEAEVARGLRSRLPRVQLRAI